MAITQQILTTPTPGWQHGMQLPPQPANSRGIRKAGAVALAAIPAVRAAAVLGPTLAPAMRAMIASMGPQGMNLTFQGGRALLMAAGGGSIALSSAQLELLAKAGVITTAVAATLHAHMMMAHNGGPEASGAGTGGSGHGDLGFRMDPNKYRYYFGEVEKPPAELKLTDPTKYKKLLHNYNRSQQMKQVLTRLGIRNDGAGRGLLEQIFQKGLKGPEIKSLADAYGETIVRAEEYQGVTFEVSYLYEPGEPLPRITTFIPKE